MKFALIFVCFYLFNTYLLNCKESAVTIALEEIAKVLTEPNNKLTIFNFAENDQVFDVLRLKSLKDENPLQLIMTKYQNVSEELTWERYNRYYIEDSAILSFTSVHDLKEFNEKALPSNALKTIKLFVFCRTMTIEDISMLKSENENKKSKRVQGEISLFHDMNDILQQEYFLVDRDDSIKLLTFIWYTSKACNVPQLVEINRFDKNTNKWKNSKFVIEKTKNFHGCEIIFGFSKLYPEFQFKITSETSVEYKGYGVELINMMAKALNFSYRFNPFVDVFDKSLGEYHFKDLVPDMKIEFVPGTYFAMTTRRYCAIQLNVPVSLFFAVPPPVPYDGFEKLYLPFDLATWIWTLIVFAVAFLTIFIVNRMKLEIQNLIFGENVRTPSLNVIAAFCGISQVVMPTRNFARFLVMSFILYSFMIRNLYQGLMCEFFQSDLREPKSIKSVEDIDASGFEYYLDSRLGESQINRILLTEFLE